MLRERDGGVQNLPTIIRAILGASTRIAKPSVTKTMLMRIINRSFRDGAPLKRFDRMTSKSGKRTAEAMRCPDALNESRRLA